MELEIKHLAAYLPYQLECNVMGGDGNIYDNCLLTGASTNDSYESFCFLYKDDMIAEVSMVHIEDIKPILRPLSDLTKELYYKLSGTNEKFDFGFWYGKHNADNDKRDYIYHSGYTSRSYFLCDGCNQFSYKMMQFFFENHFDIFGLIKAGLAVERN